MNHQVWHTHTSFGLRAVLHRCDPPSFTCSCMLCYTHVFHQCSCMLCATNVIHRASHCMLLRNRHVLSTTRSIHQLAPSQCGIPQQSFNMHPSSSCDRCNSCGVWGNNDSTCANLMTDLNRTRLIPSQPKFKFDLNLILQE